MPSPRCRYRSVSGDWQRRRRTPGWGRGGLLLAEVLGTTCRLGVPRPSPPTPKGDLYAGNSHPRRGGAQRSPGPGRSRRDGGHRPVPSLRRPARSWPPGTCPGRSGRHLWASGCSLRRGRWVLGDRSQRQGGGGHAPARQARSVEPSPRRASELTACSGSRTHLVDHVHPRVDRWPTIPLKPAARDRPRCGECRACRDCAGCL